MNNDSGIVSDYNTALQGFRLAKNSRAADTDDETQVWTKKKAQRSKSSVIDDPELSEQAVKLAKK